MNIYAPDAESAAISVRLGLSRRSKAVDRQQIAISGLGGQGVLFLTRLLAETALDAGLDILSSETHGMAMRGGAVVSHLKVGGYASPLIRAGRADLALFLAAENLAVHPHLIGPETITLVNAADPSPHAGFDAGLAAQGAVGSRQAANLVLLGFALGRGHLFTDQSGVRRTLSRLNPDPAILEANQKALAAGLQAAQQSRPPGT
jgi:indolepyruvate ferredoxin oxidoreductase beta subunit